MHRRLPARPLNLAELAEEREKDPILAAARLSTRLTTRFDHADAYARRTPPRPGSDSSCTERLDATWGLHGMTCIEEGREIRRSHFFSTR